MNLRENGLPVDPPPPGVTRVGASSVTEREEMIDPVVRVTERLPTFNMVRAIALLLAGVLTGSQALVGGGCFFLAVTIYEVVKIGSRGQLRNISSPMSSARASISLLVSWLIISMSAGLAGHDIFLLQAGIVFNRVNLVALGVALSSLLVRESGISAPLLASRWAFAAAGGHQLNIASSAALTSVLMFLGVLGNVAGLTVLDPFAGILVAPLVFQTGWQLILETNSA